MKGSAKCLGSVQLADLTPANVWSPDDGLGDWVLEMNADLGDGGVAVGARSLVTFAVETRSSRKKPFPARKGRYVLD